MSLRGVGIIAIVIAAACSATGDESAGSGQLSSGQGGVPPSTSNGAGGGAASPSGGSMSTSSWTGGAGGSSSSTGGALPCKDSADCNDGLFCNGVETCVAGVCHAGNKPCDDGVPCTLDTCDEGANTCAHVPHDSLCNDGIACNGVEQCDPSSGCHVTGPDPCDDMIDCTTDQCDLANDVCLHVPNNAYCNDGDACNGVEVCDPPNGAPVTGCTQPPPLDCDDGIACTDDSCSGSACAHAPKNGLCPTGFY